MTATAAKKQSRRRNRGSAIGGAMPDMAIFTIVARNYMSYAATLMQSVATHHPEAARYVFLADEPHEFPGLDLPAEIVVAADIGIPNFAEMAFRYTVIELNTAVKPHCFRWLYETKAHRRAVYLDPDILVVRPLSDVVRLLDRGAALVLTPHITQRLQDGCQPDDLTILKSGIYNLGFAAFASTAAVREFLEWWAARLERHCRVDIANHLFTDQRWMDLAPAFIRDTAILHHPGYNLAYWNLAHRPVAYDAEHGWQAAGEPLHFVHFSGVDPRNAHNFSKHQNRFSLDTIGGLRPLFELYLRRLIANGYHRYINLPYGYAAFGDGRPINWLMRHCFRRLEDSGAGLEVSPPSGSQMFDAAEPELSQPGLPDLTRIMYQLWLERPDLRSAFSLDTAAGRIGYLKWFVESAEAQAEVDDASLLAAAALGANEVEKMLPARLRQQRRHIEPPWSSPEPWRGAACDVQQYLGGRVRLGRFPASLPLAFAILWERRADLQAAFPFGAAEDVDRFIAWCLTDGIVQRQIDPELIDGEFWRELDTVPAPPQADDDLPITRGLWLLHGRCDEPDAVAGFPADRRSRLRIALWFLLTAPRAYGWPRRMAHRLHQYAAAPVGGMSDDDFAIPRLVLMLWEARDDLRAAFDPDKPAGRLGLLHWFLFHGLAEYGLAVADLPDCLQASLAETASEAAPLPLLHRLILVQRPDVGRAFDTATADGRRHYLRWFAEHGAAELACDALRDLAAVEPGRRAAARALPRSDIPRVLLTGCLDDASGRGEDIRMTMAALDACAVPYLTLDRSDGKIRDSEGGILDPAAAAATTVNIVHLNADTALSDYLFLRRYPFGAVRLVGYWAWELAALPAQYLHAFSFFDEIWAATRFAFAAFDTGHRPVHLMPMPVVLPGRIGELTRAYFRLPERAFLFLFTFDFGSYAARKNPQAAIAAFRTAFPENRHVRLILKTINAERYPEQWQELRDRTRGDRRIIMRNGRYSRAEMLNLIRLCDCYVSLHRSEGFGRGPAEAMLLARPVVATNYSGNTDFMNETNSFPVDYSLVPVGERYPGGDDQVWAEPDIAHAASQLRRVHDDAAAAAATAECARHFIEAHHGAAAIGARYARRLREIEPELAAPSLRGHAAGLQGERLVDVGMAAQ